MPPLTLAKLVLFAVGIALWGFGMRYDRPVLQWVGIGCLVVALVLRFVGRGSKEPR